MILQIFFNNRTDLIFSYTRELVVEHFMSTSSDKHYYSKKHVDKMKVNYEAGKLIARVTPTEVILVSVVNKTVEWNAKAEIILNSYSLGEGKMGRYCGYIRYRLRKLMCTNCVVKSTLTDMELNRVNRLINHINFSDFSNANIVYASMLNARKQFDVNHLKYIYDIVGTFTDKAVYQGVFACLDNYVTLPTHLPEPCDEVVYYNAEISRLIVVDHGIEVITIIHTVRAYIFVSYEEIITTTVRREITYEETFENVFRYSIGYIDDDNELVFPREQKTADFEAYDNSTSKRGEKVDLVAERKLKILG